MINKAYLTGPTLPIKTVYLAGPVTGLTYDKARYGWRKKFESLLPDHIHCSSPMRGKEMLEDFGVLTAGSGYPRNAMLTPAGITTRDFNDVKNCDLMIACFLEANGKLSGGTFMEYGFAHAFQIPILGIGLASDPNLSHIMAKGVLGYRVGTLRKAAHIATLLLTPGI